MLTAASGIRDRVDGLSIGADDYLTKPFAFAELVARVRALSRRSRPALKPVLERAGIVLDPARHYACRDGRVLDLTPKEFAVLEVMLRAQGEIVSAEDLLEQAWDEHADPFTNAVRVAVMTLRRSRRPAADRDRAACRIPAGQLRFVGLPPRRRIVIACLAFATFGFLVVTIFRAFYRSWTCNSALVRRRTSAPCTAAPDRLPRSFLPRR